MRSQEIWRLCDTEAIGDWLVRRRNVSRMAQDRLVKNVRDGRLTEVPRETVEGTVRSEQANEEEGLSGRRDVDGEVKLFYYFSVLC